MRHRLPAWVLDDASSIEAEAAPWRDRTPEERGRAMREACEIAGRLVRARPDADRVYAWSDPLPASTLQALARLQAEFRRGSSE
jgi:hypothetical protein